MKKRLVCVLPSKDESVTIESVLSNLIATIEQIEFVSLVKIILTDDSTDSTREIARRFDLVEVINGGGALGRAMVRGLWRSKKYEPDIVVSLDSDGQLDLGELKIFLDYFNNNQVDLLLGSRFMNGDHIEYKYPFINKIGVILLSTFLSIATKQKITDSHGGLRVMSRHFIEQVKVAGSHTYVQETIIGAARSGLKIHELESKWLLRRSGGSRVVGNIPRYIRRTLPYLVYRTNYDLSLFLPVAVIFAIYGRYIDSQFLKVFAFILFSISLVCRVMGLRGDQKDVLSTKD